MNHMYGGILVCQQCLSDPDDSVSRTKSGRARLVHQLAAE
jgi:hypothetical protein